MRGIIFGLIIATAPGSTPNHMARNAARAYLKIGAPFRRRDLMELIFSRVFVGTTPKCNIGVDFNFNFERGKAAYGSKPGVIIVTGCLACRPKFVAIAVALFFPACFARSKPYGFPLDDVFLLISMGLIMFSNVKFIRYKLR